MSYGKRKHGAGFIVLIVGRVQKLHKKQLITVVANSSSMDNSRLHKATHDNCQHLYGGVQTTRLVPARAQLKTVAPMGHHAADALHMHCGTGRAPCRHQWHFFRISAVNQRCIECSYYLIPLLLSVQHVYKVCAVPPRDNVPSGDCILPQSTHPELSCLQWGIPELSRVTTCVPSARITTGYMLPCVTFDTASTCKCTTRCG